MSLLAVPGFAQSTQPATQAGTPTLNFAGATPTTDSDAPSLPLIARIRSDPRYVALEKRVGLL